MRKVVKHLLDLLVAWFPSWCLNLLSFSRQNLFASPIHLILKSRFNRQKKYTKLLCVSEDFATIKMFIVIFRIAVCKNTSRTKMKTSSFNIVRPRVVYFRWKIFSFDFLFSMNLCEKRFEKREIKSKPSRTWRQFNRHAIDWWEAFKEELISVLENFLGKHILSHFFLNKPEQDFYDWIISLHRKYLAIAFEKIERSEENDEEKFLCLKHFESRNFFLLIIRQLKWRMKVYFHHFHGAMSERDGEHNPINPQLKLWRVVQELRRWTIMFKIESREFFQEFVSISFRAC